MHRGFFSSVAFTWQEEGAVDLWDISAAALCPPALSLCGSGDGDWEGSPSQPRRPGLGCC